MATLEMDSSKQVHCIFDNSDWCLALVDSSTLELYHKHKLFTQWDGYCLCKVDDNHFILAQSYGYISLFKIENNTIYRCYQIRLNDESIFCIYKLSDTEILLGGTCGVRLCTLTLKDDEYKMEYDPCFSLLSDDIIYPMLPLSNQRFLCTTESGYLK